MTDVHDIRDLLAVPRLSDLRVSPDGTRLVATVSTLDDDGSKRTDAIWELDPNGNREPRRLTFSDRGESSPRWMPDGSLLFLSARGGDEDTPPSLWRLPAAGEAHRVLERPGGVTAVVAARDAETVVVGSPTLPGAVDADADRVQRQQRKDLKVTAILHGVTPIRYWDHDLGPAAVRLVAATVSGDGSGSGDGRDLTPQPRRALDEQTFDVSPDGRTVVTGWAFDDEPGFPRPGLVLIDVATGTHRVLANDSGVFFSDPAFSPDGSHVACLRVVDGTYDEPPMPTVWVIDVATGDGREVAAAADLWPVSVLWAPAGDALYVTSDADGHHPVFRVDVATDTVTRITGAGHYASLSFARDGTALFALRDRIDSPPTPVRIDLIDARTDVPDGGRSDGTAIPAPGAVSVPGRLEEVSTVVEDGTTVRGWLAMPATAGAQDPAPLLLWIHGGPLSSWNAWTWRWNPWLMTAKGYAVLLPDPALSTGYGRAMVQRGWGQWGGTPFTDLMSITDEVVKRDDIDETRTAAMGGSYGGYMANWVAGHTDRFRCIVTHASLWALDQFQGTTDHPAYWAREWGLPHTHPERYQQWSPHLFAGKIASPMLVIHGDKDYRVPIGEGLRLWWDLQRQQVPSKFLYYPDEGHWVLKPGNSQVWYDTVLAWLAVHVLGEEWQQPALL